MTVLIIVAQFSTYTITDTSTFMGDPMVAIAPGKSQCASKLYSATPKSVYPFKGYYHNINLLSIINLTS